MDDLPIHAARFLLMFIVLPVWILAGFADYGCHRATHIEANAGTRESALHLVQFALIGVPVLLALFAEINALFFAVAMFAIVAHHIVAYVDVRYANSTRPVWPIEQMIHSVLEILPLAAFMLLAVLSWQQLLGAIGLAGSADYALKLKSHPLPLWYAIAAVAMAGALNLLPFLEELIRCLRAATYVHRR